MTYHTDQFNQLPNGLTLLQVNPDCAAQLDARAKDYGWLYTKGADGQWVTFRKLSPDEIEAAVDAWADERMLDRMDRDMDERLTTLYKQQRETTGV